MEKHRDNYGNTVYQKSKTLFSKGKTIKATPSKINRDDFFDTLRTIKLFSKLTQERVNGINFILNEWDKDKDLKDPRWLAYMLATTFHETGQTMMPIREWGKGKKHAYGRKLKMNRRPYSKPNKIYYGRGYVQLTWYENYDKMGRLLGVDLLNNPELALNGKIAAQIMFEGMTKGDSNFGDFTGKCLEMYFNNTKDDPYRARRIINGMDKAKTITGYHKKFLKCLS